MKGSIFKLFCVIAMLLFAVSSVSAQATGKIAGVISDKATGDPLPGVNVVLEGMPTELLDNPKVKEVYLGG